MFIMESGHLGFSSRKWGLVKKINKEESEKKWQIQLIRNFKTFRILRISIILGRPDHESKSELLLVLLKLHQIKIQTKIK